MQYVSRICEQLRHGELELPHQPRAHVRYSASPTIPAYVSGTSPSRSASPSAAHTASWPISSVMDTLSKRRPGGGTATGFRGISHLGTRSIANGRSVRCSTCLCGRTPATENTRQAGFTMADSPCSASDRHNRVSGRSHNRHLVRAPSSRCATAHRGNKTLAGRLAPGVAAAVAAAGRRATTRCEWPRHSMVGRPRHWAIRADQRSPRGADSWLVSRSSPRHAST
jgi:hypothetical protein